jgi:hypothetical protein
VDNITFFQNLFFSNLNVIFLGQLSIRKRFGSFGLEKKWGSVRFGSARQIPGSVDH